MPLRTVMRSLAHRNFRLFVIGQGLSLIGTWLQQTALPWYVFERTQSGEWLGRVQFAGQFPAVFVTLFAGVITDRFNKRRLLYVTQSLALLQALLLAILTLSGRIAMWHILALNAGMGMITAFDLTSRQAFLQEMLEAKEDLGNAIALNSSLFNAARLVGPAIAGLVIAHFSEGWCFLINAGSFLAVLVALSLMRLPRARISIAHGNVWRGLREGLGFAAGSFPVRSLLVLVSIVSLLAIPYNALIPAYVKHVLDKGATENGWLLSAAGCGALTGALFLASRRTVPLQLRWIIFAPVFAGVGLIGLSFTREVWMAMILIYLVSAAIVTLLTCCNTTLQTIVPDAFRGRVLSLYALVFLGLVPIGAWIGGGLVDWIGVMATLRAGGTTCLIGGAAFLVFIGRSLWLDIRERVLIQGRLPIMEMVEDEPVI